MNLLAATDLGPGSAAAVERAHQLRDVLDARLTLVHVVEPEAEPDPLEQRLLRASTRLADVVRSARANVDLVVRCGRAAEVVNDLARSRSTRLMVIGPHEPRPITDTWRGTFGERLVSDASCPVLVVRRPVRGAYEKVLLALDGSPSTPYILRAVDSLGLEDDAINYWRLFLNSGAHPQFQPRAKSHLDALLKKKKQRPPLPIEPPWRGILR